MRWVANLGRLVAAGGFAMGLGGCATESVGEIPSVASSDAAEGWGQIATVPTGRSDHRVWVQDRVLQHSLLFDGDTSEMLGAVDAASGAGARPVYTAPGRGEVYTIETYYSRGLRGARTDQVVVYDTKDLAVQAEIEIPPTAADTGQGIALGTVLDGERFFVALNQSPGSSASIVDLEERRLVTEIVTGGCSMVYAVGPRRFGMLCGAGTALLVELDEQGNHVRTTSSDTFFDVVADPVTVSGVRDGTTWSFASFDGMLHEIDFSGEKPVARKPWSLLTDAERKADWKVGGFQHLALHRASGRLYSVVHQTDERGSHKEPGPAIWVYDSKTHERVMEIEAPNVLIPFVRPFLEIEKDSFAVMVLSYILPPPGVHTIAVTQDDAPLLFARNVDVGAVGVLDAMSGEHLRDLEQVGLSGATLVVP